MLVSPIWSGMRYELMQNNCSVFWGIFFYPSLGLGFVSQSTNQLQNGSLIWAPTFLSEALHESILTSPAILQPQSLSFLFVCLIHLICSEHRFLWEQKLRKVHKSGDKFGISLGIAWGPGSTITLFLVHLFHLIHSEQCLLWPKPVTLLAAAGITSFLKLLRLIWKLRRSLITVVVVYPCSKPQKIYMSCFVKLV